MFEIRENAEYLPGVSQLSIGLVHFQFKGCLVEFFIFEYHLNILAKANREYLDQIPYFEVSDLGLYCLPRSLGCLAYKINDPCKL